MNDALQTFLILITDLKHLSAVHVRGLQEKTTARSEGWLDAKGKLEEKKGQRRKKKERAEERQMRKKNG